MSLAVNVIMNAADPDNEYMALFKWFTDFLQWTTSQIQLSRANSYLQWSPASGKKKIHMQTINSLKKKQLMYEPFILYSEEA